MDTSISKVIIAGDLFPVKANQKYFVAGDPKPIFGEKICEMFQSADYAVCNLEGVLTDDDTPRDSQKASRITMQAVPQTIQAISALGIKAVTLANNHAMDFGPTGVESTRQTLEKNGIKWFGCGNLSTMRKFETVTLPNGRTVIFYAVCETGNNVPDEQRDGCNIYDEYIVCKELEELKNRCDCLVVLFHGGVENIHWVTPEVRRKFHRMADSGASIVISQHTHAVGEEEWYHGVYLLYGQGNFCLNFTSEKNEWVRNSILLELLVSEDGGFSLKKHLTERAGIGITYADKQDFSDFDSRSAMLKENRIDNREFSARSLQTFMFFMQWFRGNSLWDRLLRRVLPVSMYEKHLLKCYSSREVLLRMRFVISNEEHRETMIQALNDLLKINSKE